MKSARKHESCRLDVIPLHDLYSFWPDRTGSCEWGCLFVIPPFLKAWWNIFGQDKVQQVCIIRKNDQLIGVAPLFFEGKVACIIGSRNVCDYDDLVIVPGHEREFVDHLMSYLRRSGIVRLELGSLRADAAAAAALQVSGEIAGKLTCRPSGLTFQVQLPGTWSAYLKMLDGKQRREVRRKIRRLEESGKVDFRSYENSGETGDAMDIFIRLFRKNRRDKAQFLTEDMEDFFRGLAVEMAEHGLLRIYVLFLDGTPAASTLCFDYGSTVYLYNNGYDERFSDLSAGGLAKVFSIRDSIQRGKKVFDFLQGDEEYKRLLGGKPLQLFRCSSILK